MFMLSLWISSIAKIGILQWHKTHTFPWDS